MNEPLVWHTRPGRDNGHLAKDAFHTFCGLPLRTLVRFEPAHDGQCCFQCVPAAERLGLDVATPGYPEDEDRGPAQAIDLDALLEVPRG